VRPGDVLQFQSCAADLAEPGDVVLFRRAGRLVVHRVLACSADGVLTQGDALAQPDPPVDPSDVLGRAVGLSRRGRALSLRQPGHLGSRLARWLFRRSDLAARLFLRWQALSLRIAT